MDKPILVLDFDGVLHSYTSGWQGADVVPDPPVEGAKEFLEEALGEFQVCVFSSRSHQPGGVSAMFEWCEKYFGIDTSVRLDFPKNKPPALIMIDDRAIQFDGTWPKVETLKNFKPWNKRERGETGKTIAGDDVRAAIRLLRTKGYRVIAPGDKQDVAEQPYQVSFTETPAAVLALHQINEKMDRLLIGLNFKTAGEKEQGND